MPPNCPEAYSMGSLTEDMLPVLREVVSGRVVWDLGAGALELAYELIDLGASVVVAVDKAPMPLPERKGVRRVQDWFRNVVLPVGGVEVAFLAWPQNSSAAGLLDILVSSQTVVYLGSNFDGMACGGKDLWGHLMQREVLHHVPHRRNSLIVYGLGLVHRAPLLHEIARFTRKPLEFPADECGLPEGHLLALKELMMDYGTAEERGINLAAWIPNMGHRPFSVWRHSGRDNGVWRMISGPRCRTEEAAVKIYERERLRLRQGAVLLVTPNGRVVRITSGPRLRTCW